ncbi:LPXTG cell wall anchor domain-containing protein [Enterococcus gallinarum]|uniref:LPXTG cell wall anchor domain-containing protein n=1 Tax=Enterococcus gallinarum TaxID=1353 RepID=UPI001D17BDC0|nr:LPXTG cell wall anchor domain-containing protein [Enterococcus gallinarum]MCC4044557.1 LPXTG cell wall anchor domain-containing protein [Enterococcus gallinarum]
MKRLWKCFYLLMMLILLGNILPQTVTAETQNSLTHVQKQPSHQLTVQGRVGEEPVKNDVLEKENSQPEKDRKIIVADASKIGRLPQTGSMGEYLMYLGLALLVLWGILVKKATAHGQRM